MAVHVIDTLKPKNNGDFRVVDAVDVGPVKEDGQNVNATSKNIEDDIKKILELIKLTDKIYIGSEEPTDKTKIWIDPSDEK